MKSDMQKAYERHYDGHAVIPAPAAELFTFIDDPVRLSSHMNTSSWMMGGGHMDTSVDDGHGKETGSHIRMNGNILGMNLSLDEVITHREPPRMKVWETVGSPKLLVIGHYRMNVKIEPQESESVLRVSIDYDLPTTKRWLGRLFGGAYAKWCVQQMLDGARDHFATKTGRHVADA